MNQGRFRVFCLWMADAASILLSWCICVYVYKAIGLGHYHASSYLRIWPVVFIFTFINGVARLYHGRPSYPSMPVPPVEEFRRLIVSAIATHVLVMSLLGFSRCATDVSCVVLVASGGLTALLAQPFRDLVRKMLFRCRLGQIPAVLVGDGVSAGVAARVFQTNPYYGFRVVRHFHRAELRSVVPFARDNDIKHVLGCYKDNRYFAAQLPEFTTWFSYILCVPTARAFPVSEARAASIGFLGGLEMSNFRRMKLHTLEKKALDLSLAVLIFLLAVPFFVVVPLLIKLSSHGPVFYRARRIGKGGREIMVWKFRSMYVDADKRLEKLLAGNRSLKETYEFNFKLKNDPRITPLGRLLRRTSIDELPQLFNVLCGEMALVGPRPIVEKEIVRYGESYETLSSVKPGITGLWQVSGRSDCSYSERVALDVQYILNWSPWLDIWIMYRTVATVLKMKGSY